MKRNKIFCILASLTMLVAAGASASYNNSYVNQNPVVAEAADYWSYSDSSDYKTRTWDFSGIGSSVVLNGLSDESISFTGSKVKNNKGYLSAGDGTIVYINLPNSSCTGSFKLDDLSSTNSGRYFTLDNAGKIYMKNDGNSINFTTADISTYNNKSVLKLTQGGGELKITKFSITLDNSTFGSQIKNYSFTISNGSDYSKVIENIEEGTEVTLSNYEAREGYTFDGWYIDSSLQNKYTESTIIINADTTIYGSWTKLNSTIVTYDYDYDSKSETVEYLFGKTITAPETPSREGYTFIGWFNGEEEYVFGKSVNESSPENISLKAKWEIIEVTSITLNASEQNLNAGETFQFSYEFNEGAIGNVKWSVNEEAVSTIDENGLFKAGKADEVVIVTATLEGNDEIKATCTVNVTYVECTELSIDKESITLNPGMSSQIIATTNENCNDEITYTSSNKYVFVDNNGLVRGLKPGAKSVITVKCGDFEATCNVNVTYDVVSDLNLSATDINDLQVSSERQVVGAYELIFNGAKNSNERSQVSNLYFYTSISGKIIINYAETNKDKNRSLKVSNLDGSYSDTQLGNVNNSGAITRTFDIPTTGTYSILNLDHNANDNSTLINLISIEFVADSVNMNYQYDNDAAPTAVRFIGTLSNIIDFKEIESITLTFESDNKSSTKTINTIWESVNVSADGDDKGATFEKTDNTYYVVYSVTDITGALETEFSVTLTVTFTEASGLETMSVNRTFVLGE